MKVNIVIFILLFSLTITTQAQTLKDEWVVCNNQGCKLLDPYYSEGVTFKWEGSCVNGKANGFGTAIKYENNVIHSTYIGEYKNGIRTGAGKFILHLSNETWEGFFVDGQFSGYGTYKNENGNRYEGNFINYMQHGKGTKFYPDGSKFEGLFKSFTEYTGILTKYDGKTTYIYQGSPSKNNRLTENNYTPQINEEITEYFDENWSRCDVKKAKYYRLITYSAQNIPKGKILDFYISGQKQSEFNCLYIDYLDDNLNFYVGEGKWYFQNGRLSRVCDFSLTNRIQGNDIYYFENGIKSSEIYYEQGMMNGMYQQWYKTGKLKIVAYYEKGWLVDNKYIEYDENGLGALVYNENFVMNKERWEINGELYSSQINNKNQLEFELFNNKPIIRTNYITLEQTNDYSIESILQRKSGRGYEGYGIIFGFKDWNNYYQFLISEYGSYVISGQFEGVNIKIADWTKSTAINTGNQRNKLKVMKFDDEFIFSINGYIVERPKSQDLRGNNVGIIASGEGKYVLENIIVKEFLTAEELEKKAPKGIVANSIEWKGNGTGFFINEKGYIATNYHVVKDVTEIQVEYFQKGIKYTYSAKVIVTDKQNDLAIIQIQDSRFNSLPNIPYVFSSTIKDVGTQVFALGYPMADVMGSEIKFTDGKISSKTGMQGDITVYQISVPIQPGNSGGPLFDSKGNLVGITSSALNKEYFNSENVNYAIKSTYLKNLIDVMPETIPLPNYLDIYNKPLTEKIKILSDFIPLIRVK
jgi:S1-C subfamily serine protease